MMHSPVDEKGGSSLVSESSPLLPDVLGLGHKGMNPGF